MDPRLKDNSFEAKVNALKIEKPRQLHVSPKYGTYLFRAKAKSPMAQNFGHLLSS